MINEDYEEQKFIEACRMSAIFFAGRKGLECNECGERVWSDDEYNASGNYDALGKHVYEKHKDMKVKILSLAERDNRR